MSEMECPLVIKLAVEGQASPSLCTGAHQDAGVVSVGEYNRQVNRQATAQASPEPVARQSRTTKTGFRNSATVLKWEFRSVSLPSIPSTWCRNTYGLPETIRGATPGNTEKPRHHTNSGVPIITPWAD